MSERLLFTGSRNWTNETLIREWLTRLHDEGCNVLVWGKARRGADRIAEQLAPGIGYTFDPYPAHWDLYGDAAGHARNRVMVRDGAPDQYLACAAPCVSKKCRRKERHTSHGTAGAIRLAQRARIPGVTVYPDGTFDPWTPERTLI